MAQREMTTTPEREALRDLVNAFAEVAEVERSEGRPSGGHIPKLGTLEWMRRMAQATERLNAAKVSARRILAASPAAGGVQPLPTIPDSVLAYVHAYGDARADDDGTSPVRMMEAILAIRRWSATLAATPPAAPAAKPATPEDEAVYAQIAGRYFTDTAAASDEREPTDAMVAAYLQANDEYWQGVDQLAPKLGTWRSGTAKEATRAGLRAALAARAPQAAAERRQQVGCEGDDGLLRIHTEDETCDVCAPQAAQSNCVGCDGHPSNDNTPCGVCGGVVPAPQAAPTINQRGEVQWPAPLNEVQVRDSNNVESMMQPSRAYFDAATVQEIVNAQRKADAQAAPQPTAQAEATSPDLLRVARRNLRQYLAKASFASAVDKLAAIECLDVLDGALTSTPAAASDERDALAEPLSGWKLNHVQFVRGSGKAEIGYLDPEDDRFSPIVTVDTGLYYRKEDAYPLASAIFDALAARAPQAVAEPTSQAEAAATGHTRAPNGEPCNTEDWNAGYAVGFDDGKAVVCTALAAAQPSGESK